MTQYTPEQVERMADELVGYMNTPAVPMLRAYAATLRQQAVGVDETQYTSEFDGTSNPNEPEFDMSNPPSQAYTANLRQQAVGVDEAMVERAVAAYRKTTHSMPQTQHDRMRAALQAAQQAARVDEKTVREIVERYIGKTNKVAQYIADDIQAAIQAVGVDFRNAKFVEG